MTILFTMRRLKLLTGSELFAYELCRRLSERHTVVLAARQTSGPLKKKLLAAGVSVKTFDEVSGKFDVIHANQSEGAQFALHNTEGPIIQTVHSHLQWERPVFGDRIKGYVAIRPQIADYLQENYEIPYEKIAVILNPIDLVRFKPKPRKKDKYVILAPCTLDEPRKKFVSWLISRSGPNCTVRFMSDGEIERHPNVEVVKPVWNVERAIQQADEVASFHLGRVNLEAMACGVPTTVYTDETGGAFVEPIDQSLYDSGLVAQRYESLYQSVQEKNV